MMAERVELYQHAPSSGKTIPVDVLHFTVEDSVPDDEEISWAVCRLHLNRSRGPLEMRAEHLCQRLREAMQEEEPDATHWLKVVAIVQAE